MKPMLNASAAFATLFLLHGTASTALAQGPQDYIVRFREGTTTAARADVVRKSGAALGFNFGRVNAAAVRLTNPAALAALQNDPSVLAIIPDRRVAAHQDVHGKPGGGPNGGGSSGGGSAQVTPLGVVRVGAPTSNSNGSGIGVAVLDTGVDLAHSDLDTVDAFNSFGAQSCQDDQGHGTHVSGIVAARNNTIDVVGVAPNAQIYCVKVLDSGGNGSDATVMAGLEWVRNNFNAVVPNIRVVNMSLGREGTVDDNPDLHALIIQLEAAGVTIVVSAGNDPSLEVSDQIPAGYAEVVAVASTTAAAGSNQCRFLPSAIAADTASYFTTDGAGVTVSAPGEDKEDVSKGCLIKSVGILSTRLGGGTTRMSGTSMAAPHVAGVVARYYQAGFTGADIRQFFQGPPTAVGVGAAPLPSPTSTYTFDGILEGIVQAP